MKLTTVGIDLAKNVFQVHGIDERGKVLLKKQLRRDQMATFFVNLLPCLIGMKACGSAHHWARKLAPMGHTVRLMAPQFVKPPSASLTISSPGGTTMPAQDCPLLTHPASVPPSASQHFN